MQNTIPSPEFQSAAQQALARREAAYAEEVRRLLDAGLEVMRTCGTEKRPRVADIVAAAGLSNDAFYRHFRSKDALVAALVDDGAVRLRSYLDHQMAKEPTPEAKVRRWVEGVMSQAEGEVAATTLAVIWNGDSVNSGSAPGRPSANAAPGALLEEPFAALGSARPALDAALVAHAVFGRLAELLWLATHADAAEVDHLVDFALGAVSGPR
ncbi:MAG TPA: TetR/AcrR family transcriptional regulator [Acidimicrobiia bacterium]|nr:TetR/AcrR family transcriptional regulator [Acidimicrobiia bacterium]